jgi:hypothetical protein
MFDYISSTFSMKAIYEMNEGEITQFINKYLVIKDFEKKKYGEVFTPIDLINKMLDKLPKDVWSNPNLKWLDPTAGIGNFIIIVYLRLMNGLQSWEQNEVNRRTHIIKNMLYMGEINKNNCKIIKNLFGSNVNLHIGDFLEYKGDKMDIIIGNPPFQDNVQGKNKLYERIFLKSMCILNKNGYLAFITPDNIFSGNGLQSYNTLIENQVEFVSFNKNLALFFPSIQQRVCFFLLKAKSNNKATIIENQDGDIFEIQLINRHLNPIRNWTLKTEQLTKSYISNKRNNAIYNRGKPLHYYKGKMYSIIFKPNQQLYTNDVSLAVGYGIKKAVIFLISPKLEFVMDYDGKYGIGPNTFYIPFQTNKQGKMLEKFLNSNVYKTLAFATKTSRQFLKIGFIEYLNLDKIFHMKGNKTKRKRTKRNGTKRKK